MINGSAERYYTPNQFDITIRLTAGDNKTDRETLADKQRRMTQELKRAGIDLAKLTVGSMSNGEQARSLRRTTTVKTRVFNLRLTDFGQVQDAFDALDKAEVKNATLSSATRSDKDSLQSVLVREAVRDARAKADNIASAANVAIVRTINIDPGTVRYYENAPLMMMSKASFAMDAASAEEEEPEDELTVKDIRFSASVTITYGIKDLPVSK